MPTCMAEMGFKQKDGKSNWDWGGLLPRSVCSGAGLADLRRAQDPK